jgi:hypothetical protein
VGNAAAEFCAESGLGHGANSFGTASRLLGS